VQINQEIPTLFQNLLVVTVYHYIPECIVAHKLLQIRHLVVGALLVKQDEPLFGIYIDEKHLEAGKSFHSDVSAVQEFVIAHDVAKYLYPHLVIQQELSFACGAVFILPSKEKEKFFGFILGDTTLDEVLV
jgi:hypothetical protein